MSLIFTFIKSSSSDSSKPLVFMFPFTLATYIAVLSSVNPVAECLGGKIQIKETMFRFVSSLSSLLAQSSGDSSDLESPAGNSI